MIHVEALSKQYGAVTALDGVDLHVGGDGLHALVGPNGSGKTTLVRSLLGLTTPSSGTVDVDGTVGAAFQQPSFYDSLTARENLDAFGALVAADPAWLEEVVDALGLDPALDRIAADLSGGFARKLDVALALARRPDHLVLDEPLGDLDDVTRDQLVALAADYATDRSVLVSTHNLAAFAAHVDHLTVLHRGRVLVDAPRADLDDDLLGLYRSRIDQATAADELGSD